jgi:hypothetical protein
MLVTYKNQISIVVSSIFSPKGHGCPQGNLKPFSPWLFPKAIEVSSFKGHEKILGNNHVSKGTKAQVAWGSNHVPKEQMHPIICVIVTFSYEF